MYTEEQWSFKMFYGEISDNILSTIIYLMVMVNGGDHKKKQNNSVVEKNIFKTYCCHSAVLA